MEQQKEQLQGMMLDLPAHEAAGLPAGRRGWTLQAHGCAPSHEEGEDANSGKPQGRLNAEGCGGDR